MNKICPTKGLLMYFFYAVKGNIFIAVLLVLVLGAALMITGHTTVFNFFTFLSIGASPYVIMMSMGSKSFLKWEKYQISMPVTRKNLVASYYLMVLFAGVAGLMFCGIITGISCIIHEGLLEYVINTGFVLLSLYFGTVLTMAGLIFPIGSTKFGESKGEIFFTLCLFGALGIMFFISWVGGLTDLSMVVVSLLQVVTAVIIFVVSYEITSKIYAGMDF